MASSATTKAARKAARAATIAAQEEIARRTRANMDDLTVFFSARQRADAVDDWLRGRVEALRVQADAKRAAQLRHGGVALGRMKERGETVRDIARMAGVSEKVVRELIRCAGEAPHESVAAAAADGRDGAWTNGQPVDIAAVSRDATAADGLPSTGS